MSITTEKDEFYRNNDVKTSPEEDLFVTESAPRRALSDERDQPSAYDRSIMLLAPREHSVFELKRKLKTHAYPEADIDEAIAMLQRDGLQSDERFCEIFVRSRSARGQGPIKIEAGLRERGVSSALISMAIEAAEVDWQILAREALEKKFGQPPASLKEKSKQLRFLAARGFSAEQSYAALAQLT
ncbi:Regulatory protein RecX [Halomonadaceae bacterium LMG 33818]|uniref:regulatory protein RecX n=1 Tax=Cernens ardua TaxID=3402176 RepID=UPI003EDC15FD